MASQLGDLSVVYKIFHKIRFYHLGFKILIAVTEEYYLQGQRINQARSGQFSSFYCFVSKLFLIKS
jgi:hypothetical protein